MREFVAGQKSTVSSSQNEIAASVINTYSDNARVVIEPLSLGAVVTAARAKPKLKGELTGVLYSMLRYSFGNALERFEEDYKQYFKDRNKKDKLAVKPAEYGEFEKRALADYITGAVLPQAMDISVNEFSKALDQYEEYRNRDFTDEANDILDYYSSCVRCGTAYFQPMGCDTVIRLLESGAVASALFTAYTQLSVFLTESIPPLVVRFHEERLGIDPVRSEIYKAVRYAMKNCSKVGEVMRKSMENAFAALRKRVPGDIRAVHMFRAYFHAAGTDAIRGLVALSASCFSVEYRLTRAKGRRKSDAPEEMSLFDALTGGCKNALFVEEILNGMKPTGRMLLEYCEKILAKRFGIFIPCSEYIAFTERLRDEGSLDTLVINSIKKYRSSEKSKKGEKDYKGFVESMNTRYRKRLYDIIGKDKAR